MVRCKFLCVSRREFKDYSNKLLYDYKFSVVTGSSSTDSEENKKFWAYTPSGELSVTCVKDGTFVVGNEYYLDLSLAE